MDIEDRKPYPLHPPDDYTLKYSPNTAELRVSFYMRNIKSLKEIVLLLYCYIHIANHFLC